MEVLDHTEEHQPTLMRDVFTGLISKDVTIRISGAGAVRGKLEAYNGFILKVADGLTSTYIPITHVASISEEE